MNSKNLMTFGLCLSLMALASEVAGQKADATKKCAIKECFVKEGFAIEGQLGSAVFMGDVKQNLFLPNLSPKSELGWGGGLRFSSYCNHFFSLRADIAFNTLNGSNYPSAADYTKARPQSINFNGSVFDVSLNGVFNLSNVLGSFKKPTHKFSVYAVGGIGFISFSSKLYDLSNNNLLLSEKSSCVVIPVGAGVKYRISSKWDIGLESTMRFTGSDLVDVVNTAGNNDNFLYTSFGLTYKLGKKADDCQWKNPLAGMTVMNDSILKQLKDVTTDSDKDGVPDFMDKDNNTPAGVKVYGNGIAIDSDGDGVADYNDSELFSSLHAKVDAKGVENDEDHDGVPDSRDMEPNTKAGLHADAKGFGITISEPAQKNATRLPSIYFDFNSYKIDNNSTRDKLADVAKVMKDNPPYRLVLTGYSDKIGSLSINKKIALKRADAVKDYLVYVFKVEASRIETIGEGKADKQQAPDKYNSTERRVDLKITYNPSSK